MSQRQVMNDQLTNSRIIHELVGVVSLTGRGVGGNGNTFIIVDSLKAKVCQSGSVSL